MYRTKSSSKYKNVKTEKKGIKFDSKKEAARFDELLLKQEAGTIRNLKLQPSFTLQEAFKTIDGETVRAITYKADFSYYEARTDANGDTYWKMVVEDVKGVKTKEYLLKKKMMKDKFCIDVVEIS